MNLQQFGLPGRYKNKTMSDISKSIQKKYKDRNDHISKRTMEDELQRLAAAQESIKEESEEPAQVNSFNRGGPIDNPFGRTFDKDPYSADSEELELMNLEREASNNMNAVNQFNNDNTVSSTLENESNNIFNSDSLNTSLRLAPIAGNISELGRIRDPKRASLSRLDNVVTPKYMDESVYRKGIDSAFSGTESAIANATSGNRGAYRANLLAAQLGKTKAMSDASLKARQYNLNEKERADSIIRENQKYNASQLDREKDLFARDEAATDNARHTLRQGIYSNLGDYGKEKTIGKSIGKALGYDIGGNYLGLKAYGGPINNKKKRRK